MTDVILPEGNISEWVSELVEQGWSSEMLRIYLKLIMRYQHELLDDIS